jgi:hypothetical protein
VTAALAAVVAAAAAVTVTAQPGGSRPAGPEAGFATGPVAAAGLAAWTVTRQAGGDIKVTVSELRDPAGLQSTLRADGVPASVTFLGQPNPACSALPFDPGLQAKIFPVRPSGVVRHLPGGVVLSTGGKPGGDMVIDPSAIPGGVGLQLAFLSINSDILGHAALVHASPQCTGN